MQDRKLLSRQVQEISHLFTSCRPAVGSTEPPVQLYWGSFRGWIYNSAMLTAYLYQAPKLMSGAKPPLCLCPLVAWTGTTFWGAHEDGCCLPASLPRRPPSLLVFYKLPTQCTIPLFFNNMYVTLQSSTCFEQQEDQLYHHSLWYRHPL